MSKEAVIKSRECWTTICRLRPTPRPRVHAWEKSSQSLESHAKPVTGRAAPRNRCCTKQNSSCPIPSSASILKTTGLPENMDQFSTSALQLTKISATSDLWYSDQRGAIHRPNEARVIWPGDTDRRSGIRSTVYYLIPEQATALYDAKITVECTCQFPPEYPRNPTIQMLATLPGIAHPILQSTFQTLSLPSSGLFHPVANVDLIFDSFTTPAPFAHIRCPVPFRHYGDLSWTVVLVSSIPRQEHGK